MHRSVKNIKNKRFGYLKAIEYVDSDSNGAKWIFKCACGSNVVRHYKVVKQSLKLGYMPSCSNKCTAK